MRRPYMLPHVLHGIAPSYVEHCWQGAMCSAWEAGKDADPRSRVKVARERLARGSICFRPWKGRTMAYRLSIACVALLAGCTGAQLEGMRQESVAKGVAKEFAACRASVEASSSYRALADRLPPLTLSPPSLSALGNRSMITAAEAPQLVDVHGQLTRCRTIALEGMGKAHPAYVAPLADTYAQQDEAMLQLLDGRATWGQMVDGYYQAARTGFARLEATNAQINAQLATADAYQRQQMQIAAASLSQWAYQQQLLNVLAQQQIPAVASVGVTQCRYIGQFFTCT